MSRGESTERLVTGSFSRLDVAFEDFADSMPPPQSLPLVLGDPGAF